MVLQTPDFLINQIVSTKKITSKKQDSFWMVKKSVKIRNSGLGIGETMRLAAQ